jgi:hypothetical protein
MLASMSVTFEISDLQPKPNYIDYSFGTFTKTQDKDSSYYEDLS